MAADTFRDKINQLRAHWSKELNDMRVAMRQNPSNEPRIVDTLAVELLKMRISQLEETMIPCKNETTCGDYGIICDLLQGHDGEHHAVMNSQTILWHDYSEGG